MPTPATIEARSFPAGAFPGAAGPRLHAFDNLRAFAMLLGVALHALIPFVSDPGAERWIIVNEARHPVFDVFVGITHSFRMQLFFVIAGFFARMLQQRRGWVEFFRNRGVRIGLPFVAGMATLAPLIWWQWDYELNAGATTHLWFLQYLLVYYTLSAPVAGLARGWRGSPRADRFFQWVAASRWKSLAWTVPTFLLMLGWPTWEEAEFGRGQSFLPHPAILGHYGLFFAFGWLLHRHQEAIPRFPKEAAVHISLAFLSIIIWAIAIKMEQRAPGSVPQWFGLVSTFAGTAMIWFFVFGIMGLFLRFFDRGTRVGRYLADASYWVYLAHLPLVIALQQWLIPQEFSLWVKAFLINLIAFAVLIASYQILVRHTFVGAVLNGRRSLPAVAAHRESPP